MLETKTGIILRSRKHGEADRILRLLFEDNKIIDLRYHGIRASQKRSQLAVQAGNLVQCVFYHSAQAEKSIQSVKELSLVQSFSPEPTYAALQRQAGVLALLEAAGAGSPPDGLYTLARGALEAASLPDTNYSRLMAFLMVRALSMHGLLADPGHCVECGRALWEDGWPPPHPQPSVWQSPEVAFLCQNCAHKLGQAATLRDTLAAIWIQAAARLRFSDFEKRLEPLEEQLKEHCVEILGPLLQCLFSFSGELKELRFMTDSD